MNTFHLMYMEKLKIDSNIRRALFSLHLNYNEKKTLFELRKKNKKKKLFHSVPVETKQSFPIEKKLHKLKKHIINNCSLGQFVRFSLTLFTGKFNKLHEAPLYITENEIPSTKVPPAKCYRNTFGTPQLHKFITIWNLKVAKFASKLSQSHL